MKHLMLISLLCLSVSCADKGKKAQPQSLVGLPTSGVVSQGNTGNGQDVTITVVSENEVINEVVVNNGDTSNGDTSNNETTNDEITHDETQNDDSQNDDSQNDEVSDEEITDDDTSEPVEVISEPKALVCDFVNENEESTLSLLIKDKMVVLKDSKTEGKLTFDRHIFSPSGNQNAAVLHEDKDFSVDEGKVLKITARLVMSEDLKSGELQVSYKVKADNKKTIQLEYRKLADVQNCVQE